MKANILYYSFISYEEFIIHIPHDPNKKDIDSEKVEENNPDDQLSITLHDAISRGIIAVATIDMDDLKILVSLKIYHTIWN